MTSIKNKMELSELYKVFFKSKAQLAGKKARLFPILKGKITDENSATSIFLSTLSSVKEYRTDLLSQIGIQKLIGLNRRDIQLHVYTEFASNDKEDGRPDGLIVLTSSIDDPVILWSSFIESKVGNTDIDLQQIEKYIKSARKFGVDSIITISNQLVSTPKESPSNKKLRADSKVKLFHWSWSNLNVTAGRLLASNEIQNSGQKYLLSELKRYFDGNSNIHKKYKRMKVQEWGEYTKDFFNKSFINKEHEKRIIDGIVKSYKQAEKNISLYLTGRSVHENHYYVKLKIIEPSRKKELKKMLEKDGKIHSTFFIDGNISQTFKIVSDFKNHTLVCSTEHEIKSGKARGQITTLKKIIGLEDETIADDIKIEAKKKYAKKYGKPVSLNKLFEDPGFIVDDIHDKYAKFRISMSIELGEIFYQPQKISEELETLTRIFFDNVFIKLCTKK